MKVYKCNLCVCVEIAMVALLESAASRSLFHLTGLVMQMRMDTNKERLKEFTDNLASLDMKRKEIWEVEEPSGLVLLCKKGYQLLSSMNGSDSSGERDGRSGMLESSGNGKPISIIFGSQIGGKTPLRHTKLVKVENVPRYTTWIYLDR